MMHGVAFGHCMSCDPQMRKAKRFVYHCEISKTFICTVCATFYFLMSLGIKVQTEEKEKNK
jgi:hypothetical protein